MPIDPNIPLLSQPAPFNPWQAFQQGQNIAIQRENMLALREQREALAQERQEQTEKLRQQNEATDALSQALRAGKGLRQPTMDYFNAHPELAHAIPLATKFFDDTEKNAAEIERVRTETAQKQSQLRDVYLNHVGDASEFVLGVAEKDPSLIVPTLGIAIADYARRFPKEEAEATQLFNHIKELDTPNQIAELQAWRDNAPSRIAQRQKIAEQAPHVIDNKLIGPDGKVIYSGAPKPPTATEERTRYIKLWAAQDAGVKLSGDDAQFVKGYEHEAQLRAQARSGDKTELDQMAEDIADEIIAGNQPADTKGLYRLSGPVRAALARKKFDYTTANLDWQATQKYYGSLNGNAQLRYRQVLDSVPHALDVIDELASKWKGGRFPILNAANLAAAVNGAYGDDVQSVARQLKAQIADVTSELGQVYMGGNAPTDHALTLASNGLSADWDEKVLHDLTNLARTNVKIKQASVKNSGPIGASGQNPLMKKDNPLSHFEDAAAPPPPAAGGGKGGGPGPAQVKLGPLQLRVGNKILTFKTQKEMDDAKKELGIQ